MKDFNDCKLIYHTSMQDITSFIESNTSFIQLLLIFFPDQSPSIH